MSCQAKCPKFRSSSESTSIFIDLFNLQQLVICCAVLVTEKSICVFKVFQIDIDAKNTLSKCILWMFRAYSCCRWYLRIILTSSKHCSCSAFFCCPRIHKHPSPAEPEDLQRKDHLWMFSAEAACNFQRFCPPTLYQSWGLEIAGYFFIFVFISFHLSVRFWDLREHRAAGGHYVFYRGTADGWDLWFVFLLKAFGSHLACLWVTAESFALLWDPKQCCVMGLNICAVLQAWALLARLCSVARNTAPSHDKFQVSLFGFQPSAI